MQVGFPGTAASVRLVDDHPRRLVLHAAVCRCLPGDFDIEHSTFQLEWADRRRLEEAHHA